MIYFFIIFGTN